MAKEGSPVQEQPSQEQTSKASFLLYEKVVAPLPFPVRCVVNCVLILGLLYLFLIGLDLMGNAFKGMSGAGVGELLASVSNPIAGLSIGVLATVLLQSSSTTTSIIVTMVGADILTVVAAIPMIMGANIGTSITNTIVAHGHIVSGQEFKCAMQGATVHDVFNVLTVFTMLPLEIITQAMGSGLLFSISEAIADALVGKSALTFTSPVKVVVKPLSSEFIKIDKNIIKGIAKGCIECVTDAGETGFCKDDSRKDENEEKIKRCVSPEEWTSLYADGRIVTGGFSEGLGDVGGSLVVLIISLLFLCFALYGIVRLLHYLILYNGRVQSEDGEETTFVRLTRKVLGFNAYLSIFFGMVMTICVQSSSIITSALVPLVALQIITVEQMLPLTLGANIGTTCTAFLASIVTEKKNAIQIALCHLTFNIFGILIWFPVPIVRRQVLKIAMMLGERTLTYRWFGFFYLMVGFIAVPLLLFGCSYTINLGAGGIVLNIILDALIIVPAIFAVVRFDIVVSLFKKSTSKQAKAADEAKQETAIP